MLVTDGVYVGDKIYMITLDFLFSGIFDQVRLHFDPDHMGDYLLLLFLRYVFER